MNVKIIGKIYVQMNASTHLAPLPATVAYLATWIVHQTSSVKVKKISVLWFSKPPEYGINSSSSRKFCQGGHLHVL